MSAETLDDNPKILELLKQRLELGVERYGHGVRVHDDTTQYGTKTNNWDEMAFEEILDGLIYAAAAYLQREDDSGRIRGHIRAIIEEKNRADVLLEKISKMAINIVAPTSNGSLLEEVSEYLNNRSFVALMEYIRQEGGTTDGEGEE